MNYLLDLERSLRLGELFFWKPNRRGYTSSIGEAGLYSDDEADYLVDDDIEGRTVKIEQETVKGII